MNVNTTGPIHWPGASVFEEIEIYVSECTIYNKFVHFNWSEVISLKHWIPLILVRTIYDMAQKY